MKTIKPNNSKTLVSAKPGKIKMIGDGQEILFKRKSEIDKLVLEYQEKLMRDLAEQDWL